jgi:hypothetical protein
MKFVALVFLIVGPGAPLLLSDTCADGLRWSGMWYQLAGLGVVLWGLNERPKALGLASLWSRLIRWLARVRDRILGRPPSPIVLDATGIAASGPSFGRAQLKTTGTPEERLDRLEDQLYHFACQVDEAIRKVEADIARLLKNESSEREKAVAEVRREIREATLGNTALDLIGVGLFVLGTVFSSIAPSF